MADSIVNKVGRRHSLRVLGVGGLSAVGLLSLVGCGGEEEGGGGECTGEVDAQSQQLRQTLQYVEQSTQDGKWCHNCVQYTAGTHGACGSCTVFTGPVQPDGYCLSWAAMPEAPAEG
ncbi:MAG: high-potential iron-sulfur protein [Sandaracinaceae bacterium]|nr:MAG: hypothetical protein EVA89_01315 [Sandaracinaceae bacterium]